MTTPDANTAPEAPIVATAGLQLVVLRDDRSQPHDLPPERTVVIGRAPDCDIRVEVPSMSRHHFKLHIRQPVTIEDLGGANGTKLNGVRVDPNLAVPIEVGNLIEAGGVFFTLRYAAARAALAMPVAKAARRAPDVVVQDASMERIHGLVEMVARSNIPVLVIGETGVGKEIISASIHQKSPRADKAYVKLNCAALPETLLESELFGYERGAFTGATQSKQGLIEAAHEGSLFLDEIGEMPLPTQAKLLRVLENGEVLRLGALKPRIVDVRFIAATNRPLPELLEAGQFRRDLYFRLNGITIPVPPLRERAGEVPALVHFFLERAAKQSGRRAPAVAREVLELLSSHTWPGNIRELKNTVERALTLCSGSELRPEHVMLDHDVTHLVEGRADAGAVRGKPAEPEARGRLLRMDAATERAIIVRALDEAGGNQTRAAKSLGISRRTLVNRIGEYGLRRRHKSEDDDG
jgi:transcriptional regulator with PAS, ATPase and Fis domain